MRRFYLAMIVAGLVLAAGSPARAEAPPAEPAKAAQPTPSEHLLGQLPLVADPEPELLPLPRDAETARQAVHHYVLGRLLLTNQDFKGAVPELRQAAALAPNVPRIWTNLGLAYNDSGNVQGAADALDKALKLAPDDPPTLYFRARVARTLKDAKTATDCLQHLLDVDTKTTPYRILGTYHLGQIEQEAHDADVKAGRAESAAAHLGAAIGCVESLLEMLSDPQSFFPRYPDIAALFQNQAQLKEILIRLYMVRGTPDKAIPLLSDLLADRPTNAALLAALEQAYLFKKDFDGAKKTARRLVEAYPDDVAGYQQLAAAYRAEGKAPEVVLELEAYHKDRPKNLIVTLQLADSYTLFGRLNDAAALYRELLTAADKTQSSTLFAALKLADLEVQAKHPVEALAVLADVMTVGPSETSILVRAATIIEHLPDPAKVLQDAQRLVPDENRNYAPFVLVGMLAEEAKRPDDAVALYDKAIAREPKASIAYSRKADLLIQANKHADALKLYETAVDAGIDLPVFHRKMGMILEFLDRPKEALEQYQSVRRAAPDDKTTRYLLAALLARTGQTDEAEKELKSFIARFPKEVQAYCQLAALYVSKGNLDAAEQAVVQAQAADPMALAPKGILAEIRFRQNRPDEAERLARAILEDHPDAGDVRRLLVYALSGQKKYKEAAGELKTLLAADPENIEMRRLLSAVYSQMGDAEAGEKELQQILVKRPGDAETSNDLGYLWADRGVNLAKAEELIRTALKAQPASSPYLDSLGWVLYKQGKFEDAAKALEGAAKAESEVDGLMWDHLGDVYWRLSRPKDAAKAWETAVRIIKEHGDKASAADLKRVEDKVQSVQAGQEPTVAPLPAKNNAEPEAPNGK